MAYKRIQGIYRILNLVTGLFYIGSAATILSRWANHKSRLKKNTHDNIYLQRAWNKYGEEAFKFEVIEEIQDENQLIQREQFYLDTFQCFADLGKGYNILKEAGHTVGFKFSEETKALWSKQRTGRKHTEEAKELIRKHALQYRHSEESKKRISESNMGKHNISEDRRQKIKEFQLSKNHLWKQILAMYPNKQDLITLLSSKTGKELRELWNCSYGVIKRVTMELGLNSKPRISTKGHKWSAGTQSLTLTVS
jgi:group I intron endonuclease